MPRRHACSLRGFKERPATCGWMNGQYIRGVATIVRVVPCRSPIASTQTSSGSAVRFCCSVEGREQLKLPESITSCLIGWPVSSRSFNDYSHTIDSWSRHHADNLGLDCAPAHVKAVAPKSEAPIRAQSKI